MLMALVANLMSNGEKQYCSEDFMPDFLTDPDDAEREQTLRVREKARAIFGALGAQ